MNPSYFESFQKARESVTKIIKNADEFVDQRKDVEVPHEDVVDIQKLRREIEVIEDEN